MILPRWKAKLATSPATAKLLMLGDSTSDINIPPADSLYVRLREHTVAGEGLAGMLTDVAHIIPGGLGGSVTGWHAYYPRAKLLVDLPDLVVLSTGINDALPAPTGEGQSVATIVAEITGVVDDIRADLPLADIVLRMPNSMTSDGDAAGWNWIALGTTAQAISTKLRDVYLDLEGNWDANVVMADLQTGVFGVTSPVNSGVMGDGVHPSAIGYAAIADWLVRNVIGRYRRSVVTRAEVTRAAVGAARALSPGRVTW